MPVVELPLPEELDRAIAAVTSDKKGFILEAVQQKLKETQRQQLERELIEGYRGSREENEILLGEFKNVDVEHWDEY